MTVINTITLRHSDKTDNEIQGAGVPNYLGAAAISPDARRAWVPSKQDNIKRGSARDGRNLDFQNTVRAISSAIDLNTQQERYPLRIDYDNASVASAAVYHPNGAYLFVALETSREVAVVDAVRGAELFRIDTALAPQGLALSADGNSLYVQEFMQRTVATFDLRTLLNDGKALINLTSRVRVVGTERLSDQVLRGKQLFYDAKDPRLARDSYMSCATCHDDGGHDGRTWDFTGFGEGLRNTIALNGRAAMGHGHLHWTANFDELQDFEGQIRELAGGTGLMDNAAFNTGTRRQPLGTPKAGVSTDLDSLAAYVASLDKFAPSPYASNSGGLDTTATAGKAIFDSSCSSCHTGDTFTRSAGVDEMADIGTRNTATGNRLGGNLSGIDVPTLLDAWATAPYLHNGSADTLADAVAAHNGMQLTTVETNQVVTYLRQLGNNTVLSEENVADLATLATSHVSPWETLAAVNDARSPQNSADNQFGAYGNWRGTQYYGETNWVELRWNSPQRLLATEVYWWNDSQGIATPNTAQVQYYNGNAWQALGNIGTALNQYNRLDLDVETSAIRISMASDLATGILEVRAFAGEPVTAPDNGTNTPPQITLIPPVQTNFSQGEIIDLVATANDSDGNVARVEFYNGDQFIGSDFDAPYTLSLNDAAPGQHSLSARVIDNDGAVTGSAVVNVAVSGANNAPVARDVSVAGDQVSNIPLVLSASDADADPLQFNLLSQPANGTLSGIAPDFGANYRNGCHSKQPAAGTEQFANNSHQHSVCNATSCNR